MFISNTGCIILCFEFVLIDLFKNIFKTPIVFFKNGILCRKIQGPFFIQCHIETAPGKSFNTVIGIIHTHGHTIPFKVEYFKCLRFAATIRRKGHGEFSFSFDHGISGPVLITKCMTAYNDGRCPGGYQTGNVLNDDGLTKHGTIQDIPDRSIRALPHLFEFEFFHTLLIRCNRRTFDTHSNFFNGIGSINGYLVIGGITVFYSQIIIFNIHLYVRENEFFFDELPDNSCHFITIQFNHGIGYFNFCCHSLIGFVILRIANITSK